MTYHIHDLDVGKLPQDTMQNILNWLSRCILENGREARGRTSATIRLQYEPATRELVIDVV